MSELTKSSFRVNENDVEAFRKFCEENNYSQAQGFEHLIQVLELNNAKSAVPNRQKEIESFEMHMKALTDAYLFSLEMSESAESLAKESFKRDLNEKDKIIKDYQNNVSSYTEKIESFKTVLETTKEKLSGTESKLASAEKWNGELENSLESAKNSAKILSKRVEELEISLKDYEETKLKLSEYVNQLTDSKIQQEKIITESQNISDKNKILVKENSEFKASVESLTTELNAARNNLLSQAREYDSLKESTERQISDARKDMELEKERAIASLREEYNEKIMKLREENAVLKASLESKK